MNTAIATGEIGDCGLIVLRTKVEKLNKRAKRLKQQPIIINIVRTRVEVIKHPSGMETPYNVHEIELTGLVPVVDGWRVIARIDFTDAGNLITAAPSVGDLDPMYRTMKSHCDHCQKQRRRNDMIVIRHDDGREMVVGRNCLADFIRTGDVEGMLEHAKLIHSLSSMISESEDEYWNGGQRSRPVEYLDTILAAASICIRKLGWKAASTCDENTETTKSDVSHFLYGGRCYNREAQEAWRSWIIKHDLYITDHDKEEVKLARQWIESLPANPNSDYLYNIKILGALPEIPMNKFGLAVSIITAAQRAREQELNQKQKREALPQGFIGHVGERVRDIPVEVMTVRSLESDWGSSTMIRFKTEKGMITWFASGDQTECFKLGEKYTITGTVKKHQNNEYGMSTIMNRVNIQTELVPGLVS